MKQLKPEITLDTRKIGGESPMYVIAEIGTSHQGDLVKARELIHAALESGADCAKFQVVFADEIVHPLTGDLDLPGGRVTIYSRFQELEMDRDFYFELKAYAEKIGLDFLASPFGLRSARLLRDLKVSMMKVASPELNHFPLIDEVASYKVPLILSSGVSRLEDIERAVDRLGGTPAALLHCITAYPAPPEQYNLRVLPLLSGLFGLPVGVSDHSLDPIIVPLIARQAGAALVEKHFCLSRNDPGLDDPIALDPFLFRRMVKTLHAFEALEASSRQYFLDEYIGSETVEAVLGSGRKVLAAAEAANYSRTNRSIHAVKGLAKGHVLQAEDLALLRTEKVLRPGLMPQFWDIVVGRTLTRDIEPGQGLVWDDLLR